MTMISRVLGFVRDIVIARFFGASEGTDAFFVAFKIPNFMRRLFAEGCLLYKSYAADEEDSVAFCGRCMIKNISKQRHIDGI